MLQFTGSQTEGRNLATEQQQKNVRDPDLIPGSGRSPGEENDYPLQYSCLENSMDRRAWWAIVDGVERARHD